ncbi:MAG: type IV secretory system conjugative DNA transfer family protein, partial [Deltaproteobacteria bacterium]|nr:type IV secretory system conjugative DNA transfer family protein [Deltaproteobacteria bacterium]
MPGPPRDRAQREAAFTSSVQAGAAWRYAGILEERVRPNEAVLDRLFDFGLLMIRKGDVFVLPPVAVKAGRAVRLEEGSLAARGQERSYRLVERARMALGPPDWREYLAMDLPAPPET